MSDGYDLLDALDSIDPDVHYDEYLSVGQALHHEGYDVEVWRSWVSRCTAPDHAHRLREVDAKWRSFGSYTGPPITGGTLVKIAKDHGWTPKRKSKGLARAMALDEILYADDVKPIVEAEVAGEYDAEVKPMFDDGNPEAELKEFIGALFAPDEHIGFTTEWQPDEKNPGKKKPKGWGTYWMTAGEVMANLDKGMLSAIGTIHDESGAWIRINPIDGQGVGNDHVTSFRYGLLESDTMDINVFAAKVKAMNLPVVATVFSGKRSLHAIVRIDAIDLTQYKRRMERLYERAMSNGIDVDKANKDASRMTRMPGAIRQGKRQFLAGLAQGAGDWEEWEEWYADATDELPDAVPLDTMLGDNLPPLKPALIDGVLRIGHKMLLSGPSKAGKSFLLINLCICLSEGWPWLGFKCRRSRVLYVNLELDDASCFNRFADMYSAFERRGYRGVNMRDIDVWNLRGLAQPMDKLLPKLVRRVKKRNIDVVVVDPIYKVQSGDENSAGEMAQFSNLFDALAREGECSVIYCHHHSKGFQGGKRSIDRASGSGVFGRDPDAILDMIELETSDGDRWKHAQDAVCAECEATVTSAGFGAAWRDLEPRSRTIESNALSSAGSILNDRVEFQELEKRCDAIKANRHSATAWRLEGTLREFPSFAPIGMWFDWPLHAMDPELADAAEKGAEEEPEQKRTRRKSDSPKKGIHGSNPIEDSSEVYREINAAIAKAIEFCEEDGVEPTRNNIFRRIQEVQGKKPEYKQICRWTDIGKTWVEWVPGGFAKNSTRNEKIIVKRTQNEA